MGRLKDGSWFEIDRLYGRMLAAKWRYLRSKELRYLRTYEVNKGLPLP